jgi:ABC-type multidrug transport system permease subunit
VLAFTELLIVLVVMRLVFNVPINGSLAVLIGLSMLFIVTALGLGLLISTVSTTQLQAMQLAAVVMLPSVLLSGFVFPRSEMPELLYAFSCVLPVTYFVEILRGVILRGAELRDLLPHIGGLVACCVVILGLSLTRFRKQVG